MSRQELTTCQVLSGLSFCPHSNILDKRSGDSCLMGLFQNDMALVRSSCSFDFQPKRDHLVQLDPITFLLYQSDVSQLEINCPPLPLARLQVSGLNIILLSSGCQAVTRSYIFDGSYDVVSSPTMVSSMYINWTELLTPSELVTLESLDADLAGVGSKTGLRIRDLQAEFLGEVSGTLLGVSTSTVVVILVLVMMGYACFRWNRNRRRHQAPQAAANIYIPMAGGVGAGVGAAAGAGAVVAGAGQGGAGAANDE